MFKNNLLLIKNASAFHSSCIFHGQRAKAFRKIMGESKKRKFYPADAPILPSTSNIFGKTCFEAKVTGNPRRSTVLNKLFMRHITDLMATGEYSSQIVGYGIEVNKVQITLDYKILKVYWITNKSEDHESIENILKKNAGFLRHELSELRVMGEVPTIVFVKDKNYSKIADVEQRLALADFGEDYQKPELVEHLKCGFEIWTNLDDTIKAKLERLDSELEVVETDDLDEIPPMPQNVLGLDREDIFKRIKTRMTASEAPHRKDASEEREWTQWSQFKLTQPVNSDPVMYTSQQEQRQAFKEFWQQRQILKMKQRRMDKNWTPDIEVLREEMTERHLRENSDVEFQEDDYFFEDIEENDGDQIN